MPTPHNAANPGDIAKTVLMPGDPLRAKVVAETYLTDVTCFNTVRNMLGYTGIYQGKRLSVMASGMGVPSMAIYSYELFHSYDVDTIIRIGTAGGLAPKVHVRDVIFAQAASTNSNFAAQYELPGTIAPIGDFALLRRGVEEAERRGARYHVGCIFTNDIFYNKPGFYEPWIEMGILATEMETAALYLNATAAHKRALGIMTVSDHVVTGESLDAEQRQNSFTEMMEIALAVASEQAETV